MYEICIYGNPILRKKAKKITTFDEQLAEFADILVEKMYEYDGIGLAAPQIGESVRAIALDLSSEANSPIVLFNPEITWRSEDIDSDSEGCLSVPGIRGIVERPISISLSAQDVTGAVVNFEKVDGLFARALQHEVDHLDGVMFVDRLSSAKRSMLSGKLKKMAKQNK